MLYGADADGFSASYFLHRAFDGGGGVSPFETRAVWNFDYDFDWLPDFVAERDPALLVCLDIPIIRETRIVKQVAVRTPIAIYDHHVVPRDAPTELSDVVFLNSRVLGGPRCNYPTSAFSAAFASHVREHLSSADLAVLAVGLIGDRAERRNQGLFERLGAEFPAINGQPESNPLFRFTYEIDSFFRSHVHDTPDGAELELARMMDCGDPLRALVRFAERYRLAAAARQVQSEVDRSVRELASHRHDSLLCAVLPVKTFSVGAIASKLVAREVAEVIAIGFSVDDRVAFELRAADNGPDLTEVLAIQRRSFIPLSAGGHPNAAGALVPREAVDEFKITLKRALKEYRTRP